MLKRPFLDSRFVGKSLWIPLSRGLEVLFSSDQAVLPQILD